MLTESAGEWEQNCRDEKKMCWPHMKRIKLDGFVGCEAVWCDKAGGKWNEKATVEKNDL